MSYISGIAPIHSAEPPGMVLYVALISILNLGLGFALACYTGASRGHLVATTGGSIDSTDREDDHFDE